MHFSKSTCSVWLLVVGMALSINAYSQSFTTNGLVAYYPFNANANDASGNGNNGTLIGTQLAADRFGEPNSAYQFNGTNAYIEVPSSSSLAFGNQITACAWVRPDHLNPPEGTAGFQEMTIACKGFDVEGPLDWAFVINTNFMRHHLMLANWTYLDSAAGVQSNLWQYVSFTYDGTNMLIYLNGIPIGQRPAAGAFRITTGSMRIGAYAPINGLPISGSRHFFSGCLDDVRIYNRALSTSEVKQLYDIESGPRVDLIKAVKPSFRGLTLTTNYQLQVSGDLNTWTNQGSPFTATNINMIYPQYWDVENWNSLYFRLQVSP
jgi:hypothetical protein